MSSSSEPVGAGTRPLPNLLKEPVLVTLNFTGQLDGVMPVAHFAQGLGGFRRRIGMLQDAFARGHPFAIDFADFRSDPFLFQQLEAGDEEIAEQFVGFVEPPQGICQGRMVVAVISELLTDVGGVLLFHMGVVVLAASP